MSEFNFIKQKNTAKIDVWYNGILIGELEFLIKEEPNIDWEKYRADKTLKLEYGDRWITLWKAHSQANLVCLGTFNSKEEAGYAILKSHHMKYERER